MKMIDGSCKACGGALVQILDSENGVGTAIVDTYHPAETMASADKLCPQLLLIEGTTYPGRSVRAEFFISTKDSIMDDILQDNLILNYISPLDGKWYELGPFEKEGWEEKVAGDAQNSPSIIFFLTKEVVTTEIWYEHAVHPAN